MQMTTQERTMNTELGKRKSEKKEEKKNVRVVS